MLLMKAEQVAHFHAQPVPLALHRRRPLQRLLLAKLEVGGALLQQLAALVGLGLLGGARVCLAQQVLMQAGVFACQAPRLAAQHLDLRERRGQTGQRSALGASDLQLTVATKEARAAMQLSPGTEASARFALHRQPAP
jgi:hypothetical protein